MILVEEGLAGHCPGSDGRGVNASVQGDFCPCPHTACEPCVVKGLADTCDASCNSKQYLYSEAVDAVQQQEQ
jgi:hypothetical protein